MNSDIYISASRRDFEAVSKIKSILHSAGYTYSGDIQSLQAASDFGQTIRAEIISSKAVLCVLSGNSSSSVYAKEDLRLALKENKIVIPIIIDNAEPVNLGEIGHLLLEIPVIRLNPYDSKSAKVILLNEIAKRCGTKFQKETLIPCANDIKDVQYDVFISCKSEDYHFARKVYQYLREHNYNVFLADTELRKKGNAEYGEIIDEALDSATHMVIVATKPEYIMSAYVKSEWRTFIEEKRSGRKMGNIVTLIGFTISDLPISLRHFQSFRMEEILRVVDFLPLKKNDNNNRHLVKLKDGIEVRCINGEYIVIDKGNTNLDKTISLNNTAFFLFQKVQGIYFDFITLANYLQEEYEVSRSQAEVDAQCLIKDWIKIGIVKT